MLNESKCGRPPPLPSPQHSSPRAGTPRTLFYTGWVITPLHLLPYPLNPPPPCLSSPRSGLLGAGLPLCGVAIEGEPTLLCGFFPPPFPLLSVPGPGDLRPGEVCSEGLSPPGLPQNHPPPPPASRSPPFPPAPRVSACGAGRGRDPAVGVRSPLLARHPRESRSGA